MNASDEDELLADLRDLTPAGRVAFAAACATRLVRSLEAYDPTRARELRSYEEQLWKHLRGHPVERDLLLELASEVERLLPPDDSDPGWTVAAGFAENAVAALAYAFQCAATGDAQYAAWSASKPIETIDLRIGLDLGPHSFSAGEGDPAMNDPLMRAELRRQRADLRDVASVEETGDDVIRLIRERADRDGYALLGSPSV